MKKRTTVVRLCLRLPAQFTIPCVTTEQIELCTFLAYTFRGKGRACLDSRASERVGIYHPEY